MAVSQENTTLSVVRVNDDCGENNTDVNLTVEGIYTPTKKIVPERGAETHPGKESNGENSDGAVHCISDSIKALSSEEEGPVKHVEQSLETPDPLLDLDQEEIEKIEHALQSEQARQILSGAISGILGQNNSEAAVLDDLLDPALTGGIINKTYLIIHKDYINLVL